MLKHIYQTLCKILIKSVLFIFLFFVCFDAGAQCSGGTASGALSPIPSSSYQTMNVTTGNYYTFIVAAGCIPTYDFSYCAADGSNASFDSQITILDNTGNYAGAYSDDYCGLQSHVTWTPPSAGTFRLLLSTYSCGSGNSATIAYKYTSPASPCTTPAPGITISSLNPVCSNVAFLLSMQNNTAGSCVSYQWQSSPDNSTWVSIGGATNPTYSTTQTLATYYRCNVTCAANSSVTASTSLQVTLTTSGCPVGPGGITSGLVVWLKPGVGVTTSGVNVTGWTDQSPAATAITVNGSPDLVSSGYNFNPYINFTLSNVAGDGGDFLATPDMNVQSFFVVSKLNDINRKSTHIWTYDQVTYAGPCTGCALHGGENGGSVAQYGELGYGNANFQASGVWRKNGDPSGIAYNTSHSGSFDIISSLGTGSASVNRIMGGQVDNPGFFDGRLRDWNGPVAEIISYSGTITTSQAIKIESYLAVKYGITMGGNGSATVSYTSTTGSTIWSANTGYHYDITGIGAESSEGLQQNKSRSINYPAVLSANDLPITIAHNTIAAPSNIANGTYIITGHNNASITTNLSVGYTHGTTPIQVRLARIWRMQTLNVPGGKAVNELEIEFDMSKVPGIGGFGLGTSNAPADLRLLLDDNTTFGQGGGNERAYSNSGVSGNLIKFKISFSDLPANGVYYFTIGSVNKNTAPLPIELITFVANCLNEKVNVSWTTASEINNDFFTIHRSTDGINFESDGIVDGAGTSAQINNYLWIDEMPLNGNSYYRLSQTDFDGTSKTFDVVSVTCDEETVDELEITDASLNSTLLFFNFSTSFQGMHLIKIYDAYGNLLESEKKYFLNGTNTESFDVSRYAAGIYQINIKNNNKTAFRKVMVVK
ncbi:MAG: hypothetical protein A3F72_06690 [Bacteroidetes bacterium RIFCSPLOWO2_12_FULL_35_15]|nr:MAG: hypothetical protein A3F72_06690 [Bacteroidetes bacterium RIFCSPLOWO2_12_FULL_35_15]